MSAAEFLNLLSQQQLIDEGVVAHLKKQVQGAKKPVSAQAVAKLLIEKGQLTPFQAKKLLAEAGEAEPQEKEKKEEDLGFAAEETTSADDLGFAPLENEKQKQEPEKTPAKQPSPKKQTDFSEKTKSKQETKKPSPQPKVEVVAADALTPLGAGDLTPAEEPAASSPLDDLFGDDLAAAEAQSQASPLMPSQAKKKGSLFAGLFQGGKGKKKQGNPWESPLILAGGGLLVILIVLLVFLGINFFRTSAEELFRLAEADYSAQSYSQAIAKYDKFVARHPDHEQASSARVRRGLAELRLATENASDLRPGLKTAQQVLPEIETEAAFDSARSELASLLPAIAQGLAGQARQATDPKAAGELLAQAEAALELVNKGTYIPTDRRKALQEGLVKKINEDLGIVSRELNRQKDLQETLAAMQKAAEEGNPAEAYKVHHALIRTYRGLEKNEELQAALVRLSEAELTQIKVVEESIEAKGDAEEAPLRQTVLATTLPGEAAGAPAGVVTFFARGSLFGLDPASGNVKWRKFLGFAGDHQPVTLSSGFQSDLLLVDANQNELLRLSAEDGKSAWRLPLAEPISPAVSAGEKIFIADRSGSLFEVDAASGNSSRHARFPQDLPVAPVADSTSGILWQAGSHNNLYAVSSESLEPAGVVYLGHAAGSIVAPPVVVSGFLLVVENAGQDYCLLHVVRPAGEESPAAPAQEPLRLKGNVLTPLATDGRRAVVSTTSGGVYVVNVDAAQAEPVKLLAEIAGGSKEPLASFAAMSGGNLWIGDKRLTQYEILSTRGKLERGWVENDGDSFLAPPKVSGNLIYHLRSRQGDAGATIAAADTKTGRILWATDVGVPIAALHLDQNNNAAILNARGDLFSISGDELGKGILSKPAERAAQPTEVFQFESARQLPGGKLVLAQTPRMKQLLLFDPQASSQLRRISLPSEAVQSPAALGEHLLVPIENRILLFDPADGSQPALPFQPPLTPGEKVAWHPPVVVNESSKQWLASAEDGRIFLVEEKSSPRPHLSAIKQRDLNGPLVAPPAVLGEHAVVVTRENNADAIELLKFSDLSSASSIPLAGQRNWGPAAFGEAALVSTDAGELVCLTAAGQKWKANLTSRPVGEPLKLNEEVLLVTSDGDIHRWNLETGEAKEKVETSLPPAAFPVLINDQLLFPAADGTLSLLSLP